MIIKGQARGRARQLAAHLLRTDHNERIQVHECRGTLAQDVTGALVELEARVLASRSQRPLYHASISPAPSQPLTREQVREAVDLLEEKLGLHGQPRVVVQHRKKDREHVHVVWSRVNVETGTTVADSWNYRLHEEAARTLEQRFGHAPVPSSSARQRRDARPPEDYELRQDERRGTPTSAVSAELTALWHASGSAEEFQAALTAAGYTVARGDRRVFVVIDREGKVHSLARRIQGASAKDVRAKLGGVPLSTLPSVAEARRLRALGERHPAARQDFAGASREVARPKRDKRMLSPTRRWTRRIPAIVLRSAVDVQNTAIKAAPLFARNREHAAQRSLLVAEYAAKIANAARTLARHEIEAAIARLLAERDAALDELRRSRNAGPKPGRLRIRRRRLGRSRPSKLRPKA
jgi:hypothetical protein